MQPEPTAPPDTVDPTMRERVTRLLVEQLALDPPSPTVDLFESGMLDSLGLVDLLAALESEFRFVIDFEDLDFELFATVDGIARFAALRSAGAESASEPSSLRLVTAGEARPRG